MSGEIIKTTLSAEAIDRFAEKAEEICARAKISKKSSIPVRLMLEDALLNLREKYGDGQEIELSARKLPWQTLLTLRCRTGESYNPVEQGREDAEIRSQIILGSAHMLPDHRFRDGWNQFTFHLKQAEPNPLLRLGTVILTALMIGFLGKFLLPADVLAALTDGFLTPTYDKFLDVLGCVSGPLIFCSVIWAIYGMGDAATLNRLGRGVIGRTLADVSLVTILCCSLFPLFGCTVSGSGADLSQLSQIYSMILGMLPSDIISPFQDGNTLQLILMAALAGICLLFLGGGTKEVAGIVGQFSSMFSFIMELIGRLLPIFIAVSLIKLIWSDSVSVIFGAWKFLCIFFPCILAEMLGFLLLTAVQQHVSPLRLVRKILPAYLIALATASSAASLDTLKKDCTENLGIDPVLTGFGVPLGVILQKTANAANNTLAVFYISGVYGVPLSPTRLVMLVLVVIATSVATPPIVGGGFIAYTALFAQMGLPTEALSIMLTLDMVTDYFQTSTEMFCLQLTLTRTAAHAGMLDRTKLTSG